MTILVPSLLKKNHHCTIATSGDITTAAFTTAPSSDNQTVEVCNTFPNSQYDLEPGVVLNVISNGYPDHQYFASQSCTLSIVAPDAHFIKVKFATLASISPPQRNLSKTKIPLYFQPLNVEFILTVLY